MARTAAQRLVVLRALRDEWEDALTDYLTLPPKPDYSVGGQTVSWSNFYRVATDMIEKLTEQINKASWEGGPVTSFHRP